MREAIDGGKAAALYKDIIQIQEIFVVIKWEEKDRVVGRKLFRPMETF